jgi:uncharacterized protein (DUF983 family)
MYSETNPYKLTKTLKMQERCSSCDTKYKIEPSFFFGAMYVSYPVGLLFAGIVFGLCYLVFNFSLMVTYTLIVVAMLVLQPIIMRLARNIWINFFMSYKGGGGEGKV